MKTCTTRLLALGPALCGVVCVAGVALLTWSVVHRGEARCASMMGAGLLLLLFAAVVFLSLLLSEARVQHEGLSEKLRVAPLLAEHDISDLLWSGQDSLQVLLHAVQQRI